MNYQPRFRAAVYVQFLSKWQLKFKKQPMPTLKIYEPSCGDLISVFCGNSFEHCLDQAILTFKETNIEPFLKQIAE